MENLSINNYKHGKEPKGLYGTWKNMRSRCRNSRCKDYKWYGQKGIEVCREWQNNFVLFRTWALANGYQNHLTIDRVDNDGNYCPENCQWISREENLRKRFRSKKED